jgi:DNA replication protein DnaC
MLPPKILRLSDCSFIEKNECVLIAGATGVGKSHLASALGHQACVKGHEVLYFNTAKLFSKLRMSKADASYTREINKLAKQDLQRRKLKAC